MSKIFLHEIDTIKASVLSLCTLVEERLHQTVAALQEQDVESAAQVIARDGDIDSREVELEEECLKILALHQPVAGDLRFVVAVMKINSDLERIGDLTANIAKEAVQLASTAPSSPPFNFECMAEGVQRMVRNSIDALVNLDMALAEDVRLADDAVDRQNADIYALVIRGITENPAACNVDRLVRELAISRSLERIADHATNIAEDVIYMIQGTIVRHDGRG